MHHLSPLIRGMAELSTVSSTTPPPESLGLNTGKGFPRPSEGPRSRPAQQWLQSQLRADQQSRKHVLHLPSAQQREVSPFWICSRADAEGDLSTEPSLMPSHHHTLRRNPDEKKRRRRWHRGQEKLKPPLLSVQLGKWNLWCSVPAVPEQCELSPLPDRGNERKIKKKKSKKRRTLQEACCCCRKNRYQIKKLCLKTVHMPAPGDFKYLWFATFLIFKISRDAVSRTWCKLMPCLTWMWLVIHCSGGKGKAGSLKGSWGSHLTAGLMGLFTVP